MSRRLRKIGLVLVGTLGALVALELVLQVGAFLLHRSAAAPAGAGADVTVLCVGDSFTYGLGAADPSQSYPSVMARSPRLAGVQVINLGWPGQDSGRVLGRLPDQLATTRPSAVCVLAGYNDFWSGGEVDVAHGGFELRTVRLARLILAALRGGPDEAATEAMRAARDAPFLGAWHAGSSYFEFLPDGSIDTHEGPLDGVFSWSGDRIRIELRSADEPLELGFRIEGAETDRTLFLSGGPFPQPLPWQEGLPGATLVDRARIHVRNGDLEAAERDWRAALGDAALRGPAALALATHLTASDRAAEAVELLRALRDDGTRQPAELFRIGDALLAAGAAAEAEEVILAVAASAEVTDEVVRFLVRTALQLPDISRLDAAIRESLATRTMTDAQRIGLLGLRASIVDDDAAATGVLFEVARLDPDADVLRRTLRWHRDRHPRSAFEKLAAGLAAGERARVLDAYDRALGGEDATGEVLGANLEAAVRQIRDAGALPVLLTYPGGRADLAATIREVAERTGADLVDAYAAFATLLRSRPRADLFVADGHCNDAGYAELGRMVAARVGELLDRR